MSHLWRMSGLLARRSRALVGLDIGSSAVKAVELEATRKGRRVVAAAAAPLPRDAIADGAILDGDAVAGAIRGVFDAHPFRTRAVAASLSGSDVLVRTITVPRMSDSELDESLYWEIDQYVPADIGDVTLDYQVLDRGTDGDRGDRMDVLLVVANRDRVAGLARVVERAGLVPVVVDVDALALCNAHASNDGTGRDAVVLAHAGASSVTVVVARAGRPEVVRNSPLAPYLHSGRGGDPGDREDEACGTGGLDGAPTPAAASAAQVAREVEGAMEDCRADVRAEPIDRLVVSGGWACAPGFTDALAERMAVPVVRLDPFRGLAATGRAADDLLAGDAPAAAVAVGLALRRSDER